MRHRVSGYGEAAGEQRTLAALRRGLVEGRLHRTWLRVGPGLGLGLGLGLGC